MTKCVHKVHYTGYVLLMHRAGTT